jgi:hypothetical protein
MDLAEGLRPDDLVVLFIEQWGSNSPMPPPRGSFEREHIGAIYSQETVEVCVLWEILATRGHLIDNVGRAGAKSERIRSGYQYIIGFQTPVRLIPRGPAPVGIEEAANRLENMRLT